MRLNPSVSLFVAASVISVALAGCGKAPVSAQLSDAVIPAMAMDLSIVSPAPREDGVGEANITFSLFVPAHGPDETFPLVFHSHGFSASRVGVEEALAAPSGPTDIESTDSIGIRTDNQVRLLWDAGYAVVSMDQRGFGRGDDGDDGNTGAIQVLDPDYEIQDAIAVLDWVEDNVPNLARDDSDNIKLGAIGSSYGGGFQLQLAALDDRLDVLVPVDTWHSLLQSLMPNKVIKKAYTTGLCLAIQADMAESGRRTTNACNQGSDTSPTARYLEDFQLDFPSAGNRDELVEAFGNHGTAGFQSRHDNPNDALTIRALDVLLIQGNRDILFNLNQANSNFRFMSGLGGDVRMLSNESGHSIPSRMLGGSQAAMGPSSCGDIDSLAAMRAWLDLKLRGNSARSADLPDRICLSLDNISSVHLDALPVASQSASEFNTYEVSIPLSNVSATENNTVTAAGQALFVPLQTPINSSNMVIAGVPVAQLSIVDADALAATNGGTTAFIGVGIQRGGNLLLIDDQVQPLRSVDSRTGVAPEPTELIGIAEKLLPGDILGVLIYGSFDQYEPLAGTPTNYSINNRYAISGTVRLPIFDAETRLRVRAP